MTPEEQKAWIAGRDAASGNDLASIMLEIVMHENGCDTPGPCFVLPGESCTCRTRAKGLESRILAALTPPAVTETETPDDWQKDPAADERWNAGVDFAMTRLCAIMRVDPHKISWDAATETLEGDVMSVLGNILTAGLGDDWQDRQTPPAVTAWTPPPEAERPNGGQTDC